MPDPDRLPTAKLVVVVILGASGLVALAAGVVATLAEPHSSWPVPVLTVSAAVLATFGLVDARFGATGQRAYLDARTWRRGPTRSADSWQSIEGVDTAAGTGLLDQPVPNRPRAAWGARRAYIPAATTESSNLGFGFSLVGLALGVGLWLTESAPATLALGTALLFVAAWIITSARAGDAF